MIECYKSSDGKVIFYIAHSDKKFSTGILILEPKTELPKHKRPVLERLRQIYGICLMKLYNDGNIKEVTLKEGESLEIPPNQYHIHSNPTDDKSITMWKAEGDITNIIGEIRKSFRKI
jgi:quercetin dioxygenase-like cupin family protein